MNAVVTKKVEEFFSAYQLVEFGNGQILVTAGSEPPGIFYLTSGQVRQYDISSQGDEVVINVFKPGAFFPMSWAINKTPNEYFFAAEGKVKARLAPANEAVEFLKTNPDVMYDLLSRLYSGMDGVLRRMAHLMGGNARTRIIYELILQTKRFGKLQPDGSFLVPIHQDEIAARAGLSRETISRELGKIKGTKLVTVSRAGISISDLKRLERLLGEEL